MKAGRSTCDGNYGSGFPFTRTQGFYEGNPFTDGISSDYTTSNGELTTVYDALDKGRLPDYHRLDLGLTKTWTLSERSSIDLDLSVTNAYDRENIFYFDRTRNTRVDQLPLLPSAGLSLTF